MIDRSLAQSAHETTVQVEQSRTLPCSCCADRFRGRDLVEVVAADDPLTWFEGDLLCRKCARDHGIL